MKYLLKAFRFTILLGIFLLLFLTYWLNLELYQNPLSSQVERATIEIEKGMGLKKIARRLMEKEILNHSFLLIPIYYLFYSPKHFKAGEYQIEPGETLKSILIKMLIGRVKLYRITIPEGLTATETASLLSFLGKNGGDFFAKINNSHLVADLDPEAKDLEGYLFPETYFFPKGIDPLEVYKVMTEEFRKNFPPEWQERAREIGFSIKEIVTLASLIEKETGLKEEKPLISAVFHNRLRKGMKLDCDPTVLYALSKAGINKKELQEKDLKFPSPYNTYLQVGLPPGPICNPGRESLRAALFPAQVNFLYFVSRGDGSHHFSSSYQEHLKAVSIYRKKVNQNRQAKMANY